ncbi:MAG: TIGR01906 family membrane protein [Anaerolineae bacterium]|nr:TIGR01906 family membrane protein [Anaerolineae bacterium]
MTETLPAASVLSWRNLIGRTLQTYLSLAFPILLILIAARLVMTPLFLTFEYNRSDFPPDFYGFTTEDRLQYAPFALNYLLNGVDISYLGDLRFPSGKALYNADELRHMRDVKNVTTFAFGGALLIGALAAGAIYLLWRVPDNRFRIRRAFLNGGILTLALIAATVVTAILNWDYFFTGFHTLFFESGTWRFAYSDTLIRLFPEQFWFDAALTIGGITITGAVSAVVLTWRWRQKSDI